MPNVQDTLPVIVNNIQQLTATIAASAKTSNVIYCSGNSFIGVQLPTAFTSGNLSFFGSLSGQPNTFFELTDANGTIIAIPTSATPTTVSPASAALGTPAGIHIPLDPAIFASIQFLIVYCSSAQVSTVNINLIMAPVLG